MDHFENTEKTSQSKVNIMVLFGGRSAEHEVSILSAKSIIAGLDPEKYNIIPCVITRDGAWRSSSAAMVALEDGVAVGDRGNIAVRPGYGKQTFVVRENDTGAEEVINVDVVFPVLHGTYGEDGTIQGLFEMAGIPYVGAGVCASSVGMDKAVMKDVWDRCGLPILPHCTVLRSRLEEHLEEVVAECLAHPGLPCFVKPANLGSSVGISKATCRAELVEALKCAALYDRKIVVEQAAENPREVEVGVIGNDYPNCSVPGEILHGSVFYDYQTKYWSDSNPQLVIPAKISPDVVSQLQTVAQRAWSSLDLNGLGRVDFMIDCQDHIWLNEVNTMPGFTAFSMFSRLWEASGVAYGDLLDKLVDLAFKRFEDRRRNLVAPK